MHVSCSKDIERYVCMPAVFIPLIVVHVGAVLAKLSVFFVVPRLTVWNASKRSSSGSDRWKERPTGFCGSPEPGLLACTSWRMLMQTWMLVSIGLYIIVFLAVRFALTKELENIANSKKLYAREELKKLRTNNWCVGILSVVLLGIIAYLMMTKP